MKDLIKSGSLAQLLLVILVWGAVAFLALMGRPIPDALLDAGFVIIGFYFHAQVNATALKIAEIRAAAS